MSSQPKNKITVEIYGKQYTILGEENPSHISLVASLVDNKMREIRSKNPSLDMGKLAVLTAVNAVNDYLKIKKQLEDLQEELKKEKD